MAKKPTKPKSYPTFSVGDRVEIVAFMPGRIAGFHGNLGPGGEPVYRVRYNRKPPMYMMALVSQLRLIKSAKPAAGETPAVVAESDTPSGG